MDQQKLDYFKKRLLAMREEALEGVETLENSLRISLENSVDELSRYDNHPADLGDVTYERGKDLGMKLFAEDRLAMIEEALVSIAEGTYGRCEACEQEIDLARLEAVPYTTLCQNCKGDQEDLERHPRPIEEDVISPPYGGYNHDRTRGQLSQAADNNAFDGEDAWQAVARYGTSETPSDIGNVVDYDDMYLDFDEDVGFVEEYENIPAVKEKDGQIYQDFNGSDDEKAPKTWANE